jgi:class 3 adenylate cyclase/predicted ATPase
MDVVAWLRGLGLEQYAPAFRDNDVDGEVLPELTADDLISIGVTSVGHRRKLLAAIAALRAEPTRDLAQPAVSARSTPVSPLTSDAERRQLTVMFCDLVGSTALSARLDPEDLREVYGAYHRCCDDLITEAGGFVAKYMGDGVLAYFGYPQAHEHDAEHAVRAGLALVEAAPRLTTAAGVPLQVRVGIATGLVVVGDLIGAGAAQEQAVVGETPNLAARLQALAEPNAVVIAPSTRRLLGDLFEYRDLGAVEVKGIAAPVPTWRVLRPSDVASRFEALRGSALTPLVGRDEEIDQLLRRWARAEAGDGQVVLVSGEPGIGKSRLTAALTERLGAEPYLPLRYFCSPYHQNSALFPFLDQLGRTSGFDHDDPPEARLEKLEALLARAEPPGEDLALIADLLSLPSSERHPLPNLSPQRQKERTLEALIRQLEGLARQQPVLMVFEDAHWIDPTSRELLHLAVERVRTLPVLLIVTFRPEFQPPWTGQPQVTMLALNRLDQRDRTALVEHIAGGKALADEVVAQIVDRTDGVPLFVEELTKSVLESGVSLVGIPTTLHDSLMARLDRLASVRLVAQIGAVIGREFSYALLRAVARFGEDELQTALARLVASELVFQRGIAPDAVYAFKHALVQDAAHGSLLRSTRQQLHAQVAEALEARFPELMDAQPELFAEHYAEAGLINQSVAFWGKAGRRSFGRSAMAEAVAQFQKALDELALLPNAPERHRQELELRSGLGAVLMAAKGFAAPETGHAYARARELWEQIGSPSEFLQIPYGQSRYHMFRGELDLSQRLNKDLLRLSRQRNDSAGLVLGHYSSGCSLMFAGRLASSRAHLEQAIAVYASTSDHSLVQRAAVHPQVTSQAFLANVLFCLGFPDQAMARISTAIAEARMLAHPATLATALGFGARLLSFGGDNPVLGEWVDEMVASTTDQVLAQWNAGTTVFYGLLKVKNGDLTEGISLLRSGLAAYRATGTKMFISHLTALLAAAYEIAGDAQEALTLLDDALALTGERWFTAELNRHKGELLLQRGHTEVAEELYRKALSIAVEQEAKMWELRAAMSLARLWRDQCRRAKARDLLAPVYGWFTEGFDTADLKDAQALLNELT